SGKSSLINQVLHPALLRKSGAGKKTAGAHADIIGHEFIDKILSVDQTPIGKSTRSNPATYTKLFSLIRELFARLPEAQSRGYKSSRFSFNVDGGRCIECGGAGVKSVDMQFLAPVEVVCEACGGQRYNRETLEIRFKGKSISEVLDLTVGEALGIFSTVPRIDRTLKTLDRLGLSYLKLGQPATTLSGGEGQRLKLANELQKKSTGRTLYLLDEPTTGLHFDDVRVLIDALDELVGNGNSVVVIEHNLEVIQAADYVIDLGPGGGSAGGEVVAAGTPEELSRKAQSYTGLALKARLGRAPPSQPAASGRLPDPGPREIRIEGAALNNLKSVDVSIPHQKLTVLTGVSGSGKSSLAFGTLFAEGQRRYLDSLSTYARHFLGGQNSPPVERITGMAPAIAIDQKSGGGNSRSTVATMTEVHDHLRLLFAHIGQPHCPECGQELTWVTPSKLAEDLVNQDNESRLYILAPLVVDDTAEDALRRLISKLLKDGRTRILAGEEELRLDEGEDAALRRILNILRSCTDEEPLRLFLVVDRMVVSKSVQSRMAASIEACYAMAEGVAATRLDGGRIVRHSREPSCGNGHFTFSGSLSPRMFSYSSYEGACPSCGGAGKEPRVLDDSLIAEPSRPLKLAIAPPLRAYLETFRPSALVGLDAVERHLGLQPDYATGDLHPDIFRSLLYGLGDEKIPLALKMGQHEITWAGLASMLEGWLRGKDPNLKGQGLDSLFESRQCAACEGQRLRPESLAVRVASKGIHDLLALSIADAESFFRSLVFSGRKQEIAGDVLRELSNRLRFLTDVGLGYLELNRSSNTLSGGEAQRIRLASQLGNRLTGAIYVLDEPTIGLHEWDTRSLLKSLQELKDAGNTVVVVEHDRHLIESADHLIDLGPGPGERGGEIVSSGTPSDVATDKASLTGSYLRGDIQVFDGAERRQPSGDGIRLRGATLHNLDNLDV
ncbi:MAG: excinuclease ABC subunit A, partial [Planctomycetes bacterium]|nr:excinuclease ABC subunit A [Planctomycetota bacterium]